MPKHPPQHERRLNTPRPMCDGKRAYPDKMTAEGVAIQQEIINPDLKLAIYRCLKGKHWHLTRQQHENQ